MADHSTFEAGSLSLGEQDRLLAPLEERVQRLEEKVAGLQDTAPLEERIVTRINQRLRDREAVIADDPPAGTAASFADAALDAVRPRWLLFDLIADARAMGAMFFDFRYRPQWTTYLAVFGILPLILLSHYWFPPAYLPVVGTFLDKALNLALAFVLYKILSRESLRYRNRRGG